MCDFGRVQVKYAAAKTTGALADFVSLVTSNDMFNDQLKSMGVDTSKMPLGDISQRTVDAGFQVIIRARTPRPINTESAPVFF